MVLGAKRPFENTQAKKDPKFFPAEVWNIPALESLHLLEQAGHTLIIWK